MSQLNWSDCSFPSPPSSTSEISSICQSPDRSSSEPNKRQTCRKSSTPRVIPNYQQTEHLNNLRVRQISDPPKHDTNQRLSSGYSSSSPTSNHSPKPDPLARMKQSTEASVERYYRGQMGLGRGKSGNRRWHRQMERHEYKASGEFSFRKLKKILDPNLELTKPSFKKAALVRDIRAITEKLFPDSKFTWQAAAIVAIDSSAEAFLVHLFEMSSLCVCHAKRVTLMPRDMALTWKFLNYGPTYTL